MVKAPDPTTVLRDHQKSVQAICFHNERKSLLFSGDVDGKLKVWNLEKRRVQCEHRVYPKDSGLVSMCVGGGGETNTLLTQGRDGSVKIWDIERLGSCCQGGEEEEEEAKPLAGFATGCYNFCRFSTDKGGGGSGDEDCTSKNMVSIPGSDACTVEVWDALQCVKAAEIKPPQPVGGGENTRAGMCMALCLKAAPQNESKVLWAGYESGVVACWDLRDCKEPLSCVKLGEEPLMALDVDRTGCSGVCGSVSTELVAFKQVKGKESRAVRIEKTHTFHIKEPGVSDVTIRGDRRIFVSAGWDGHVRVYDYKKKAALAVLKVSDLVTVLK